jgi:hypothetical protein
VPEHTPPPPPDSVAGSRGTMRGDLQPDEDQDGKTTALGMMKKIQSKN